MRSLLERFGALRQLAMNPDRALTYRRAAGARYRPTPAGPKSPPMPIALTETVTLVPAFSAASSLLGASRGSPEASTYRAPLAPATVTNTR
jgi:hypothetical protein